MKAVVKIDGYAARLPAQAKCDLVVVRAALLETDGSGDAVGVGDETSDVDAEVMLRVGVCDSASMVYHACHGGCHDKGR